MQSNKVNDDFQTVIMKSSVGGLLYELHFNLWKSNANDIHCLDIGLMCPLQNDPYTVELFFPGKYAKDDDIICLNEKIQDTDIASNIFNCGMSLDDGNNSKITQKDKKIILISNYKTGNKDYPYSILKGPEKTTETTTPPKLTKIISESSNKTIVHILVDPIASCTKTRGSTPPDLDKWEYFRFRIQNFDLKPFSIEESSKTNFIVPVCDQNTIIDFRVNDAMLMSSAEQTDLTKNSVEFEKIHFLLIDDLLSKNVIKDSSVTVRLFENAKWKEYLGKDVFTPMLAYHYRKKKEGNDNIKSASFLVMIEKKVMKPKSIWGYIFIALVLGIIGNVLANWPLLSAAKSIFKAILKFFTVECE